ncbi:MAG: M23 family metallopeptidase [Clostridia bacterium]
MKITHLPFNGIFKVTWTYGAIWSGAGTRDSKHHGIDLVGITSKDVYSTCKGVVEFAGYDKTGFGNYVKIVEDTTGLAHFFAHLESINVTKGLRVEYTTKLRRYGSHRKCYGSPYSL